MFSSPIEPGVLDISVVPNAPAFFTAGPGLAMWSTETGALIRTFELSEGKTATSVCSSRNGKVVFVGLSNGEIAVYDSGSGKFIHKWKGHQVKVTGLDIAPDGRSLASNAGLYDLRIWEIDSDSRPTVSPMNIDIMSAFDNVGDGTKTVAVLAWMAGTVSGYQLVGAPTLAFPSSVFERAAITESAYGPQVAYSPDGRFLAASAHIQKLSGDFQVLLVDTMNKQVRMLEGIYGCSLAFTRDSRILLTGGLGAPVLWDVQTGEKLVPGEGVN